MNIDSPLQILHKAGVPHPPELQFGQQPYHKSPGTHKLQTDKQTNATTLPETVTGTGDSETQALALVPATKDKTETET